MSGELVLVPKILTATDPVELSKLVAAERIKRQQRHAKAYYSSHFVSRSNGSGFTKYVAFLEFNEEEK